ncbi:hypothetical protein BH23PLA1_BH23PLA1_12240 [soil metagenome]
MKPDHVFRIVPVHAGHVAAEDQDGSLLFEYEALRNENEVKRALSDWASDRGLRMKVARDHDQVRFEMWRSRYNLDVSPDAAAMLQDLVSKSGQASEGDVLMQAVFLLNLAYDAWNNGGSVTIENPSAEDPAQRTIRLKNR